MMDRSDRESLDSHITGRWGEDSVVTKTHPTWDDVTARGPVTLVVAAPSDAYRQGWVDGRRRLLEQIEELHDCEDCPNA